MRTLIIYMSSHGTTQDIADYLRDKIPDSTLFNLRHNKPPHLEGYENVIIGASVHGGDIQSAIKKYLSKKEDELLRKNLGLFLCYMDFENGEEEFNEVYPYLLREHAIAKGLFGGEFRLDKMDFFEKLIVRKFAGEKRSVSKINWKNVNEFIDTFRELNKNKVFS